MSSTNSSDRLTLLSYASFNHHIPIHDHSWRQHQWIQAETMVALASLALQSVKPLSERQFGKQTRDTYFVWSWRSRTKLWYWSLHVLGLYRFFPGHLLRQWNLTTASSGSDGGSLWRLLCSLVHPKTQHLKSLFGADIVYLQQLQQVISNGGPQLLTQGCVYAYRAASQMGGIFSPWWREQRENLKQLILRDCLWYI